MPLYDAVCPDCGVEQEDIYAPHPDEPIICPDCGVEMTKKFGTFAIRGFPRTPKNHLPKSMGGDFDRKEAYWQG